MMDDSDSQPAPPIRQPTDTRAQRRRDDRALFLAVIVVLLVVGGGLIFLIYGTGAFVTGLACLLFGVGLLALLWLVMTGIERWANR
jgi:protein-S-isoprenylcysteine O-methyltransferase Ste14